MNNSTQHEIMVRQLLVELSKTGVCKVWSQPTGMAYRDGVAIRYGVVGSADISGILMGGKRLEIEVKTGRAVQTDRQKAFQQMILSHGGIYVVARNIPETVEFVKSMATV